MKYAVISSETNIVENVIIWDGVSPWTPPAGTSLVNVTDVPCDIGWVQQPDGTFAPAPEA